jgi:hypothetical protein
MFFTSFTGELGRDTGHELLVLDWLSQEVVLSAHTLVHGAGERWTTELAIILTSTLETLVVVGALVHDYHLLSTSRDRTNELAAEAPDQPRVLAVATQLTLEPAQLSTCLSVLVACQICGLALVLHPEPNAAQAELQIGQPALSVELSRAVDARAWLDRHDYHLLVGLTTILMDGVGATGLGEELACDPYTTHPAG